MYILSKFLIKKTVNSINLFLDILKVVSKAT